MCQNLLISLTIILTFVSASTWNHNKTVRLRRQSEQSSICTLPGYPENGKYTVRGKDNASPGAQLEAAQLQISCHPGYKVFGNQTTLLCVFGHWSNDMPKCVRYCKLNSHPSVKYRCQVTNNESEETFYRDCQDEEPSGQLVRPQCNEPNYYYTGVMSLMHCNKGRWNYIAICQPECGTITPDAKELVFGGRAAKRGEFPWHAAIYRTDFTPVKLICGGTLVSNTVVISAAHCFWNKYENALHASSLFAVALGKFYRGWNNPQDSEAQKFNVTEVKVPVRYQGATSNFQDDIALLWLSEPAVYRPNIRPVCLDFDITFERRQLQDGKMGKVAGWGVKDLEGNPSQVLKVLELPYVSLDRCIEESPSSFRPFITSDKICAGYTNGSAVCEGDSGGGLVFSAQDYFAERFYLRGIVSTAPETEEACNAFARTSFTQVTKHKRFIEKYNIQLDTTTSDTQEPDILCILPPYPNNGSYVMLGTPDATPGQGYYSANLVVNCDKGYEPERESTTSCKYGRWTEVIPRCLPRRTDRCKRPADWGETHKCSDSVNNSQRLCNKFEPNGTAVTRYCSSEIFLNIFNKTIVPTSVATCIDGDWVGDLSCVGDKSCGLVTLPDGSELPWSAAVYEKKEQKLQYVCGATIVNNKFIITAAHCVWGLQEEPSNVMISVGKLFPKYDDPRDKHVQTSEVSEIIIPDKYGVTSFENDIALLVLAKRLQLNSFVQPACLDPSFNVRTLKDALGKTASWRMSNSAREDLTAKALLRSVAVRISDQHQCLKDMNLGNETVPDDKICAYDIVGQGICPGDSGLGLVYPVDGRYVLLGVISVGRYDRICSADEPILFSSVFNKQAKEN